MFALAHRFPKPPPRPFQAQDNIESESVYFVMRLTQLLVLLLFAGQPNIDERLAEYGWKPHRYVLAPKSLVWASMY